MQLSDQVRAFLNERRFAVLATIGEGGLPQQTVMWYMLDDDEIVMNTARERLKAKLLQRDPRASICIEDGYRYVTIAGSVALDDDPATTQADIVRLAERYVEPERVERMAASFRQEARVALRLRIERVVANGFER